MKKLRRDDLKPDPRDVDIFVKNAESVHIERMDDGVIWVGVYLPAGGRRTFRFIAESFIEVSEDET